MPASAGRAHDMPTGKLIEALQHHSRTAHQAIELLGDSFKVTSCGFRRNVAINDVLRHAQVLEHAHSSVPHAVYG